MKLPPATITLARVIQQAPTPAARNGIDECHAHYARQFATVAELTPAESIAAGTHDACDRTTKALRKRDPNKAKRIACKRGCAHCCYLEVAVTTHEAALLVKAAADAKWPIDRERLQRQAAAPEFRPLPLADRRCVFLKPNNECAVYAHRPVACRKYLVLDTPKFCDTAKHPGAEVGVFFSIEAECLQSAAFNVWPNGPMARQLLEWL